jgi:hypothetical protein
MKYRAILYDPGDLKKEREQQILSNSRADIDDWAAKKLQAAISESAAVTVWQSVETKVAYITKKGKPE